MIKGPVFAHEWRVYKAAGRMCSSHPECKAFRASSAVVCSWTLGLQGECCPARDGLRMACCSVRPWKRPARPNQSTISLQSVHGGYITVSKIGLVGWRGKKTDPDAQPHGMP